MMGFLSGEERSQAMLLPERIENYVSEHNPVRVIDAYITSLNLSLLGFVHTEPATTGRPMYDRKVLLKLYVYGYMNRIRSSRRLETESRRNVEVMWLLGKLSPDHKTIARFRHDNATGLENVFRDFVKVCVSHDLYGKTLVAIDGSTFKAVNSDKRNYTKKQLRERLHQLDRRITDYFAELETNDQTEGTEDTVKTGEEIAKIIKTLQERKATYEGYAEELEQSGETQKSLTDEDSRLMRRNGKYEVSYNVQTAVDAKHKLITEFEVTNKVNDRNQLTPMTCRVQEILEKKEITFIADAGYDSIQDIVAARELGAEVHIAGTDIDICVPCERGEEREITAHQHGRSVYYAERNIALCPMGKVLYPRYYTKPTGKGVFQNSKACKACACPCTKDKRFRYQVPMEEAAFSKDYDDTNLWVKQVRIVAERELIQRRKSIVEHPFGNVKWNMEARNCLTRGIAHVSGEFALLFLAYNLKRVLTILGVKPLLDRMA